ncbi:hypothetical protein HQ36_04860 [Porphyromonas gingivicanis]|uniref:Uncharacterized protein n=1 Tax=Porphyromonas gingivicanis TaxID=266762 RepID=A0A0A2G4K9_9PORP|nr:hypothetical protein [Porphyromonas gingivicanis]KGN98233.1 hypothetical protein HQ36_04860 [Porphyromonas gingivicanis]
MKKLFKSNLLLILIAVLLFGCRGQKEDFLASSVSSVIEEKMPSESSTLRSGNEFLTLSEADKSIIKNYCNDLKTLAFESSAMTAKALNYDSYKEVPIEEILRNPMVAHLQFLDIKEEGTNNPIRFYDLSLEDREEFLNAYLKEEQKSIEEKVALVPELLTEIEKYDLACEKIFSSQHIERLDYENMDFSKFSIAKTQSSKTLKRYSTSTKEVDLFDLIEEELDSQNNIQDHVDMSDGLSPAMLRSSSSSEGGGNTSVRNKIISKHLEARVRKGDILIREKNLFAIGKNFSIGGHTAIINTPLNWNSQSWHNLSIDSTPKDKKEGHSDGVQEMTFDTWCRPHAVLGIRKVITRRSKVKIRGRRRYYRSYVPIEDLSRMADRAKTYIGRPYGNVFKTMKEVPNKFICSSLVWYCAKMEYGVDISNGSRKYVWPSDILKDSETYIKTEYKK